MAAYFTARRKFDSASEQWESYLEFSKIPGVIEIVGLDSTLCPLILEEFDDEDLEFFSEDCGCGAFTNLEYLLKRIGGVDRCNVLAVIREPSEHIEHLMEPGFSFAGYELLEELTGVSALSNCGGFPKAFSNDELNELGLIPDFVSAREVQRLLTKKYPTEPHAETTLYAIWRLDEYAPIERS